MKVAVVGGGIAGLSAAYFLAKGGAEVSVFEQKYLLYGASGRNSGGLTAQLNSEPLIKLALRSLELYDILQSEVGFNFLLRRDGYVKVAGKEDEDRLDEEVKLQKKAGVKVKVVDPEFVKGLFPDINTEAFSIASYLSDGGVVFPWPVVWGLAKGCRDLGVQIYDYCPVTVETEGREVVGVRANGELIRADYVVNAAGAWSVEISKQAGVELDNRIFKEEICVTESLKPYLNPYILDISSGVYLSQSMRGEIVGGIIGNESALDTKSSLDFLVRYAKRATELVPKLRGLSVLRQWAGVYDAGRRGLPVIGETEIRGFVQLNGFGRHGMSLAPAAGEGVAELLLKGKSRIIEPFTP